MRNLCGSEFLRPIASGSIKSIINFVRPFEACIGSFYWVVFNMYDCVIFKLYFCDKSTSLLEITLETHCIAHAPPKTVATKKAFSLCPYLKIMKIFALT